MPVTTSDLPPAPRVAGAGDLDKSMAAGLAWTAAAKWSSQIVSWGSLVIVTRLLAPSDFGLVGMATLYSGLLMVVTSAFGTAVTTLRDLTDEQLAQLNSVATISGFLACLVSCGLAIPLGHFFRSPHLPLVIVVSSAMFIVSGLRTVPYSLLYRDMHFRLLSIFDAAQAIAQGLITLILAWLGFGYWALILGTIASAPVVAALQIAYRPCRFAWPRISAIKDALTFSRHIMVSSLSWYGYSNADFLIAGRMLGQTALGAYTLAWNLATIPLEKITTIVTTVSYAYLSAAQDDAVALRRYLRIITEGLSLITFPITLGLGLVAPDFIPLVLGSKWRGAIVPLEILAIYGCLRCIVTILPSILNVTGESRFVMRATQGALILMPIAFYEGSRWGASGIAFGWVIAYPAIAGLFYHRTLRKIKMPWRDYFAAVRPSLMGCGVMTAIVETVRHFLTFNFSVSLRLGLEVFAGAAAYILTLTLFHGDRVLVFWNFVRTMRNPVRVNGVVEEIAHN
jgi:O-antigen/teichoic acid export membrane protein